MARTSSSSGIRHRLRSMFNRQTPALQEAPSPDLHVPPSSSRHVKLPTPPDNTLSILVTQFMHQHKNYCVNNVQRERSSSSSELFTLFPLLPTELRIKIWEAVAAEPHTVELSCTPSTREFPQGQWFSHSTPPVCFFINRESRAVALRQFAILSFATEQVGLPPATTIYINFSTDSLWLCSDLAAEWARDLLKTNSQLRLNLRSLVINQRLWNGMNPSAPFLGYKSAATLKWRQANPVCGVLQALEMVHFHDWS